MKVDKRSEKYVQPSRRRRRGDGDDAGLAHERRGGGGGGGGGRACPSYRTALLPSRQGEGRGGVCGGIHQTPFVLMNRPTMVHAR